MFWPNTIEYQPYRYCANGSPHTCGPTFGRVRSYFELTQALISYRHSTEDNKTEPWTQLFSAYFKTSCMTRGNRAL